MTFKNVGIIMLVFCMSVTNCHTIFNKNTVLIEKCCDMDMIYSITEGCINQSANYNVFEVMRSRFSHTGRTFYDHWRLSANNFSCAPDKNEIILEEYELFNISTYGILDFPPLGIRPDEYCLDMMNESLFIFTCQPPFVPPIIHHVNKYGMLISIPFLFITLLVYIILPDKKIQTKCLMAYVTCLMKAYIFLMFLQFNSNLELLNCQIIAGFGVYFFMSSFCWMNITCVDMFFIFSGIRAAPVRHSSKWKRFALYVIFANGTPMVLLSIIFGINSMEKFTGHPNFAKERCWLEDGLPELLYYYGPMALLLSVNTILFGLTTYKIRTTMKDNKKMLRGKESSRSGNNEANKQDYVMYIKLFVIMGINWMMDFFSWLVNWCLGANKIYWIWYPTDFCNAIYGILIFVIFVCKKTVWIKLKQRYYICMGKPNKARALSSYTSSGYQASTTERTNMSQMDETSINTTYNQLKHDHM